MWPTPKSSGATCRMSPSRRPTCTGWTFPTMRSTSSTPTRCYSTSPIPFRRCGKCGECARRADRRGPRRGLRGFHLVSPAPGAGPVARPLPASGSRQPRRTGRGPAPAVVGPAGGLRRHHAHRQPVVLCHAGHPRMVGRNVGRPDPALGRGSRAAAVRSGHSRVSSKRFRRRGGPGPRRRTAGWRSRTAKSSAGPSKPWGSRRTESRTHRRPSARLRRRIACLRTSFRRAAR